MKTKVRRGTAWLEDVQKCLDRLQKIENVPKKTANEFSSKFGKGGTLTKFQAVKNLIEFVNQ
jgi:glutamate 5-kinase